MVLPPCYEINGSGASRTCTYLFSNSLMFCGAGYMNGFCPAADLYGCCVASSAFGPGGYTTVNAVCYYGPTTGEAAKQACTSRDGGSTVWQTTLPSP